MFVIYVCHICFFLAVCCSGLWGSSFELRLVSMTFWHGLGTSEPCHGSCHGSSTVPVVLVCDSYDVSVPVVAVFAWAKMSKGAVGSATDEWGICRQIVIWGGWALPRNVETCEFTRSFKIIEQLRSGQWAMLVRRT